MKYFLSGFGLVTAAMYPRMKAYQDKFEKDLQALMKEQQAIVKQVAKAQ